MKVVINRCHGGFGLSAKATARLAELQGSTAPRVYDIWRTRHRKETGDTPGMRGCTCGMEWNPDIPRRIRTDRWTPAEHAIHDAIQVVEMVGAHVLLTDAVRLLGEAQEKVAQYVDGPTCPQ